jgi:hypothetical protein
MPGSAEDAQITDAESVSGDNSIGFDGDHGTDLVLDFGDVYSSGTFHAELKVKADSGYYFNFQAGANIGDAWALDIQATDSTLYIYNYDGSFIFHSVTEIWAGANDWHTIALDIDLDASADNWTVSYDGSELVTFTNPVASSVSMIDFYPLGSEQDFYVDDVMWSWAPSPRSVTFQVDMNYFTGTVGTMAIAGNYINNWCGDCTLLSDDDADGVWEATVDIAADAVEYKFLMDNWATSEQFAGGETCTMTTGEFTNRYLEITEDGQVVDVVCWEQCDGCEPWAEGVEELSTVAPLVYPNPTNEILNVEFGSVVKDMSISIFDLAGREVARPFNSFNGSKAVINVSNLPKGAYFVVGNSVDASFNQTIVVAE